MQKQQENIRNNIHTQNEKYQGITKPRTTKNERDLFTYINLQYLAIVPVISDKIR
jgi:hypothetical protein